MLPLIALFLLGLQPAQAKQVGAAPDQVKTEKPQRNVIAYLGKRGIEVEFTGNGVFSTQELLALLASDSSALDYIVKGAQSPEHLDLSLRLLRNLLATRGYLQASFGETKIERTFDGHKIIIPINEGARYRIGKVSFEYAKLLSPEQLTEMFSLKQGDIANGEELYEFLLVQLKNFYDERGYIQYTADPEPTYHSVADDKREGIVDYLITIDEGQRFNVYAIEFVGNKETPDQMLRAALRLLEHQPFSNKLLRESLKNIEELNLFEKIDLDKDVDYAVDKEQPLITIRIRLKEKKQP